MYLTYYHLREKPFQITTDPRFLWLGEKHQEALATLNYGLLDNKGFLLLTGDVGTGKTTLIKALIENLGEETLFATVVSPLLDKMEFFRYLAEILGVEGKFNTKVDFLTRFTRFLNEAHRNHKTVLLIIDEAQSLTKELLEEIRLLSNIEKDNKKLLNIFFVGQNEFNDLLMEESSRALRQRITITYHLDPLSEAETVAYVDHRLKVAGRNKDLFTGKAIRKIHFYTRGYPRLINILCDHALLTGYVREMKTIPPAVIHECARELALPGERSPGTPKPPHRAGRKVDTSRRSFRRVLVYTALPLAAGLALFLWASPDAPSFSRWLRQATADYAVLQRLLPENRSTEPPSKPAPPSPSHPLSLSEAAQEPPSVQNTVTAEPDMARDPAAGESPPRDASSRASDGLSDRRKRPERKKPGFSHPVHGDREIDIPAHQRDLAEGTIVAEYGEQGHGTDSSAVDTAIGHAVETGGGFREGVTGRTERHPAGHGEPRAGDTAGPAIYDGYTLTLPFNYNTNALSSGAFGELDRLAAALATHPDFRVIIRGYTDSSGNRLYNLKLSEFRANIVKSYMVGKGIEPERIESVAMADADPLGPNDSPVGRATNRRVEVEIQAP